MQPRPTSRRPSGLRKTKHSTNSLAHRTTWLPSVFTQLYPLFFPDSSSTIGILTIITMSSAWLSSSDRNRSEMALCNQDQLIIPVLLPLPILSLPLLSHFQSAANSIIEYIQFFIESILIKFYQSVRPWFQKCCHKDVRHSIKFKINFVFKRVLPSSIYPHSHVGIALGSTEVGGQAVLGRQNILPTPWLTERHGYDPTCPSMIPEVLPQGREA